MLISRNNNGIKYLLLSLYLIPIRFISDLKFYIYKKTYGNNKVPIDKILKCYPSNRVNLHGIHALILQGYCKYIFKDLTNKVDLIQFWMDIINEVEEVSVLDHKTRLELGEKILDHIKKAGSIDDCVIEFKCLNDKEFEQQLHILKTLNVSAMYAYACRFIAID